LPLSDVAEARPTLAGGLLVVAATLPERLAIAAATVETPTVAAAPVAASPPPTRATFPTTPIAGRGLVGSGGNPPGCPAAHCL
jgi:hypothetical protein